LSERLLPASGELAELCFVPLGRRVVSKEIAGVARERAAYRARDGY